MLRYCQTKEIQFATCVDVWAASDFGDARTARAIAINHDDFHQLENVLIGCKFAELLFDDIPLDCPMLPTGLVKRQGCFCVA